MFNIIRGSVYGESPAVAHCLRVLTQATAAVLVWTVICLGIAAHFQSILVSSDLSAYSLHIALCAVLMASLSSFRPVRYLRVQC